jgi:Fe-S cluster assembly protein SufD
MPQADVASPFDHDALRALSGPLDEPARLRELRERAFAAYEATPMPSPETEEWRYTDLREFDLDRFVAYADRPIARSVDEVDPRILAATGEVGDRAGLAIQHDSTVVATRLDPDLGEQGVVFESLDDAGVTHVDLVAPHLHSAVAIDRSRFTAMHAAFRRGGTFVHVPAGVSVGAPLQTLTYVDRDGLAVFPHTLIVLEEGAELTFIDRYVSPDLGAAFSNAAVELILGPGSRLRYVALQEWGAGMTHLSVQRALLARDAELHSLGVAFGASLSRAEVESILEGDGSSSEMLGVYFAGGDQHFDHRSIQDHVGSLTSSDLLYKGVLTGQARTIYSGNVIIEPGAHRCDAYQTNRNILLSEEAKADSIPNLEILSNDPVRCGHAASVGPVDDDTLFYIQSRGIAFEEAQRLVVTGFLQEVLDRVTIPEVRSGLEQTIVAELERGAA